MVMFFFFLTACSGSQKRLADALQESDSLPMLDTRDVETLISDSGVIRYRITAPLWQIFDRKDPSRWSFEEGVYLENFDDDDQIYASIKADTAYFFDKENLWELRGDVFIQNLQGEEFSSEQIFWNQETQKVYSDKFIRIVQADRIITGHGFESNQQMTVYTIRRPEGIFYVDQTEVSPSASDTLQQAAPDPLDKTR